MAVRPVKCGSCGYHYDPATLTNGQCTNTVRCATNRGTQQYYRTVDQMVKKKAR